MILPSRAGRLFAIFLLFAVAVCLGQSIDRDSQSNPTIARKLDKKGLSNLGEVTPMLYRGALPTPEGIDTLQSMGIGIVVDLRNGQHTSEEQMVTQRGMRYVSLPSACYAIKDETFAQFLAVVRANPQKKIFVHCKLGTDRTGMAVASYRMAEQGWTADAAMKEMQAFGFSTAHHVMCPGLAAYEQNFPERLKTNPAFQPVKANP